MNVTIQQVKTLDYNKLSKFINTLSLSDLQIMQLKFDAFINLLCKDNMQDDQVFTKAIHIAINIDDAINTLQGVK
jgi:hypothetical protein